MAFGLKKRRPVQAQADAPAAAPGLTADGSTRPGDGARANGPLAATASSSGAAAASTEEQRGGVRGRIETLVSLVRESDDAALQAAILELSGRHRLLRPLAFALGAFALLFNGLKLILSNWKLLLVQILPAMWIWVAMYDLKAHVLHGKSFNVLRGPILIPIGIAIVALTVASFFLNAVFAFAISRPGSPEVRPAAAQARRNLIPIVASGAVVGVMLALAATVVTREGHPWFALSMGVVVGIMMVSYVAVPARLIGVKPRMSKRDKLTASAVGGAIGATVCTPPYALGRVGILMLGSKVLFVPGIILFAVGVTLQAGATGAVRAVKMSYKLKPHDDSVAPSGPPDGDPGNAVRAPAGTTGAAAPGVSEASGET